MKVSLYDGLEYQLRNAIEWFYLKCFRAPVPAAYHQLSLVVGVDQADQIAGDDPMLMSQTRPWQD